MSCHDCLCFWLCIPIVLFLSFCRAIREAYSFSVLCNGFLGGSTRRGRINSTSSSSSSKGKGGMMRGSKGRMMKGSKGGSSSKGRVRRRQLA